MTYVSNDEVAISVPFSLDSAGNIVSTTNQDKIWADRVRAVIGTVLGERVMRPDFGTRVAFSSFETRSGAEAIIRLEIERAFILQLPLLNYVDVDFEFNETENIVLCNLLYELPNRKQATTRVGVVTVSGNNPAYEETA
jgi:phage baseplate assembly protein W